MWAARVGNVNVCCWLMEHGLDWQLINEHDQATKLNSTITHPEHIIDEGRYTQSSVVGACRCAALDAL